MTVLTFLALFYELFVLILVAKAEFTSVIQTHSGPVRGEILNTIENSVPYSAFKGIPYAKPPIKNLRFQVFEFSIFTITFTQKNRTERAAVFVEFI